MYIAAGVRTDCEKLISEFIQLDSLRFEKFADIWRKMKFGSIFCGKSTAKEMLEFIEEVQQITLSFCLPPCNFQVRVAGLYLLYSLYVTQPQNRTTKIRVTIFQWKELMELIEFVIQENHHDVQYIFRKLQAINAFHFVATAISMGPDLRDAPSDDSMFLKFREQKSSLVDLIDKDGLEQLTAIHQHYYKMKCELAGEEAEQPEKSLNVIHECLSSYLVKSVESLEKKKTAKIRLPGQPLDLPTEEENEQMFPNKVKKMEFFSRKAKVSRSRRHREITVAPEIVKKSKVSPQKKKKAEKAKAPSDEEIESLIIDEGTALNMPIIVPSSEEIFKDKGKSKSSKKKPTKTK